MMRNYIELLKQYGIQKCIKKLTRKYCGEWFVHKPIKEKLIKQYKYIYKDYINIPEIKYQHKDKSHYPIWVMWWQGEEEMPEIVRLCYDSVKRNASGHSVKLITEKNYMQYISLPNYITDKVYNGIISLTHLSDIIRFALLFKYGGMWIDSTVYVSKPLSPIFSYDFFTLRHKGYNQSSPADYRWALCLFAGEENNIIFLLIYSLINEFWLHNNKIIKYFLTDYYIAVLYDQIPAVKRQYDKLAYTNPCYNDLENICNDKFCMKKWQKIISNTMFYKLSHKKVFHLINGEGQLTFYGFLLNQNHGLH